jgi:hypothetical protein
METTHRIKITSIVLGGIVLTLLVVALIFYGFGKEGGLWSRIGKTASGETIKSIEFGGTTYDKAFTLPPSQEDWYMASSYEWVPRGETLDAWKSLITTHKFTATGTTTLSAETYAQNVIAAHEQAGAVVIETSVINQDVEALGVDPNNPPYLMVYAYPGLPIELSLQKVENGPDASVRAFVYSIRFSATSTEAVEAYLGSQEIVDLRKRVIMAEFPY